MVYPVWSKIATHPAMKNALYYGDNLALLRNPKYVKDASINLCYIDPPFNSKRRYNQIYTNIGYEDRAQAQAFIDFHKWDEQAIDCFQQIITNDGSRYTEQTIELKWCATAFSVLTDWAIL